MKIQYISCHSVLEYDEVRLLAQLGYDVKSNGAYRDPRGAYTLPRPGIPELQFDPDFFELTGTHAKTALPPELIEPFDVIIIMSGLQEQILVQNWDRIKHKRVIWRSIGQNTPTTERLLQKYVKEGLQIVRYSPKERGYENFAGENILIRFPKSTDVYPAAWNGKTDQVINFTQSLKGRGRMAHYDEIMGAMAGFNAKVYGPGNEDLGIFNGGDLPFEKMITTMCDARVYVYGGTWPACYTLSFMEALMVGVPIVGLDTNMVMASAPEQFDYYEAGEILKMCGNRPCTSVGEMRNMIQLYLDRPDIAQAQSADQVQLAQKLFSYDVIGPQWRQFLEGRSC